MALQSGMPVVSSGSDNNELTVPVSFYQKAPRQANAPGTIGRVSKLSVASTVVNVTKAFFYNKAPKTPTRVTKISATSTAGSAGTSRPRGSYYWGL